MTFEAGNQFGAIAGQTNARRRMLSQQLISVLQEDSTHKRVGTAKTNRLRSVAMALVEKAEDGDTMAIREIADRLEGKPVQMISGDPDGSPLVVEIVKLAQLGAARVIEHEEQQPFQALVPDVVIPTAEQVAAAPTGMQARIDHPVEMITGSPVEPQPGED